MESFLRAPNVGSMKLWMYVCLGLGGCDSVGGCWGWCQWVGVCIWEIFGIEKQVTCNLAILKKYILK